ncbi:MAG: hypothetical protein ACF8OB_06410 [Phycisphaeraceae bacterium JB051]
MNRTFQFVMRTSLILLLITIISSLIDLMKLYAWGGAIADLITLPSRKLFEYGQRRFIYFQLPEITKLFLAVMINAPISILLGALMSWASPTWTNQHYQRIKCFGKNTAITVGFLTAIAFLALDYVNLSMHPNAAYFIRMFTSLGKRQAYMCITEPFPDERKIYYLATLLGITINTISGYFIGCFLAIMSSRFCIFKNTKGLCPQCDYDLTGTPEHCPECGWEKDAKTPINVDT